MRDADHKRQRQRARKWLQSEVTMPILMMGLIALAVFGAIGVMLFVAESSERRQEKRSHHTL